MNLHNNYCSGLQPALHWHGGVAIATRPKITEFRKSHMMDDQVYFLSHVWPDILGAGIAEI